MGFRRPHVSSVHRSTGDGAITLSAGPHSQSEGSKGNWVEVESREPSWDSQGEAMLESEKSIEHHFRRSVLDIRLRLLIVPHVNRNHQPFSIGISMRDFGDGNQNGVFTMKNFRPGAAAFLVCLSAFCVVS